VIVKNLENIQGDERDVIYFSITFCRDAAGNAPLDVPDNQHHRTLRARGMERPSGQYDDLARLPSVLSLTFESQVVANMIHSRHGKRLDCT
jgi:hypothetical protein